MGTHNFQQKVREPKRRVSAGPVENLYMKYGYTGTEAKFSNQFTSKFPDFLTHFMEQTMIIVRTTTRATPVGQASPPTRPNSPGLPVSSQVAAVYDSGTLGGKGVPWNNCLYYLSSFVNKLLGSETSLLSPMSVRWSVGRSDIIS